MNVFEGNTVRQHGHTLIWRVGGFTVLLGVEEVAHLNQMARVRLPLLVLRPRWDHTQEPLVALEVLRADGRVEGTA